MSKKKRNLNLQISAEVWAPFEQTILRVFGYKKGNITAAVTEAIISWTKKNACREIKP